MKNLSITLAIMAVGSGITAGFCAIAIGLIAISQDNNGYGNVCGHLEMYTERLLLIGLLLMMSSIVVAIKFGREK